MVTVTAEQLHVVKRCRSDKFSVMLSWVEYQHFRYYSKSQFRIISKIYREVDSIPWH